MTMTTTANGTSTRKPRTKAKPPPSEMEATAPPPSEPFTPTPPATPTPQPADTFRIRLCFQVAESWYSVVPLDPDPGVMKVAFRMTGLFPDGKTYDVGLDAQGRPHCECKGFAFGKGQLCRHLKMLAKARLIQLPQAQAEPAKPANGEAQPAV
jgi:hypothetical protein